MKRQKAIELTPSFRDAMLASKEQEKKQKKQRYSRVSNRIPNWESTDSRWETVTMSPPAEAIMEAQRIYRFIDPSTGFTTNHVIRNRPQAIDDPAVPEMAVEGS